MKTLTIETLTASIEALRDLSREALPGRVAYTIAKNAAAVDRELKPFQDARRSVIMKHAKKDEAGEPIVNGAGGVEEVEDMDALEEELAEMLREEVEIPVRTLTIDDLAGVSVKPGHLMAIDWMLE